MKNIKQELFNFKRELPVDQEEVYAIVENHIKALTFNSEMEVVSSLSERLKSYRFMDNVRTLTESLEVEINEFQLVYELKNLYKVLERQNAGMLYRQPLNVILETINLEDDSDRMYKIANELALYDWISEIKAFTVNLLNTPEKKANLLSSGSSDTIYTLVESVEDGHIALVNDSWFLLNENKIEKVTLESQIKDEATLKTIRTIESALRFATITEDRINFTISEYLTIGLGLSKGEIYLNEDVLSEDTTLESLFNSPVVPIVNKNFYPVLIEVSKNVNKFMELDVVKKVTNFTNPTLECYTFNYKDCIYSYRCDKRYGNSFFKYESAQELVNEVKSDLNFDLTYFYEDKLNKEVIINRKLEDKEREITLKLEEISFNIEKIDAAIITLGDSEVLTEGRKNLSKRHNVLSRDLESIKELRYNKEKEAK